MSEKFWCYFNNVGAILPIFTGKPGGSFIRTNSLSLLKCLKGAMTSNTFSSISTDNGKSGLCKQQTIINITIKYAKTFNGADNLWKELNTEM